MWEIDILILNVLFHCRTNQNFNLDVELLVNKIWKDALWSAAVEKHVTDGFVWKTYLLIKALLSSMNLSMGVLG